MPIRAKILMAIVMLVLGACSGESSSNDNTDNSSAESGNSETASNNSAPSEENAEVAANNVDARSEDVAQPQIDGSATVIYGGETYELEIYQCNRDDSLGDIGVINIWAIESGAAMPDLGVIRLHVFTRGYSTVVTFMLDGEADVNVEQTGENRVRFVDGMLAFENDEIKVEIRC